MRVGSLIAAGHDCDVYEAGAGRVVRRARDGRSLEREASVMRHARRHGFPAPEVFDAGGPDILMELVDGPSIGELAGTEPQRADEYARLMTGLLRRLGKVRAPGWLPAAPGAPGNALLHLDLHPGNVLLTGDGPRVVDWAGAARGAAAADVACTWLLLAAAPHAGAAQESRRLLLEAFVGEIDRAAVRPYLKAMAERRRADVNTEAAEKAVIDDLVARETGG